MAVRELEGFADQQYCCLTTTGRRSGRPHTIEIWFAVDGGRLYLLSGGGQRSDWLRNLLANPEVRLRLGERIWTATARVVDQADQDGLARRLLATKYHGWRPGKPLSRWASTALPVAVTPDP
ncbi:MAG: nitroreductase family deazaflavin-dependent oxidoreductase [Actinomycetota bacterium]|nr:nitroreductase family deazaflavin-dependent oxidoreductase [Actinomycetota bacterium]